MINVWFIRYVLVLVTCFFIFYGYHFTLGKETPFLSMFYTTQLIFCGLLLSGIFLWSIATAFMPDKSVESNELAASLIRLISSSNYTGYNSNGFGTDIEFKLPRRVRER